MPAFLNFIFSLAALCSFVAVQWLFVAHVKTTNEYSPLLTQRESIELWAKKNADLVSKVENSASCLADTLSALKLEASATDSPGVCIGITLFRRKEPYVLKLLKSLLGRRRRALEEAAAASAGGARLKKVKVNTPLRIAIGWVPPLDQGDEPSLIETLFPRNPTENLEGDVDWAQDNLIVFRGRDAYSRSRSRRIEAATYEGGPRKKEEEEDQHISPSSLPIGLHENVSPPNLYALVLDRLRSTWGQRECSTYLMLEDDVIAGEMWEERLQDILLQVASRDTDWRQVKLFYPAQFDGWKPWWDWFQDPMSIVPLLLVAASSFLVFLLLQNIFSSAYSLLPCCPSNRCGKISQSALFATACVCAMAAYGRQHLGCPLFLASCPSLYESTALCCTQAHAYNPENAAAFIACLATTPLPFDDSDGPRYQIDLSMHRCLAAGEAEYTVEAFGGRRAAEIEEVRGREGGGGSESEKQRLSFTSKASSVTAFVDALPIPPIPDGKYTNGEVIRHHAYMATPHLFQHVGLVTSEGLLRPSLLTSSYWERGNISLSGC